MDSRGGQSASKRKGAPEDSKENRTEKEPKTTNKIICDPVHGTIKLDPVAVRIIDTKEFQRLRWIKQLGGCEYVYPGATHSRFAHSIGVYYLTCQMLQALREGGKHLDDHDDVLLTSVEEQTVKIAALCHDIGHGPFSHMYEDFMKKEQGQDGKKWSHEDLSVKIIQMICDNPEMELKEKVDVKLFQDLLQGLTLDEFKQKYGDTDKRKKAYMFQIVSNKETSIDVDKWDYFARDSLACGVPERFGFERALMVAKIAQTDPGVYELCYREKDALNMYNMFNTRYTLYKKVYCHSVVKAAEMMIMDAMLLANQKGSSFRETYDLDLAPIRDSEKVADVNLDGYLKLTDSLLEMMDMDKDKDEKINSIITRLKKRELYKMVFESKKKYDDYEEAKKMQKVYQEMLDSNIGDEQAEIQLLKVGYWAKERDPVEHLKFYSKKSPDVGKPIPREQVSELLPKRFSETIIRIFSKVPHRATDDDLKKALEKIEKCEKDDIAKEDRKNQDFNDKLKSALKDLRAQEKLLKDPRKEEASHSTQ